MTVTAVVEGDMISRPEVTYVSVVDGRNSGRKIKCGKCRISGEGRKETDGVVTDCSVVCHGGWLS
jgi:hypothetical protein